MSDYRSRLDGEEEHRSLSSSGSAREDRRSSRVSRERISASKGRTRAEARAASRETATSRAASRAASRAGLSDQNTTTSNGPSSSYVRDRIAAREAARQSGSLSSSSRQNLSSTLPAVGAIATSSEDVLFTAPSFEEPFSGQQRLQDSQNSAFSDDENRHAPVVPVMTSAAQAGRASAAGGYDGPGSLPPFSSNGSFDQKPPKKKKRTGWRVVFWISIIVLIAALLALGLIFFSYFQGRSAYNDILTNGPDVASEIDLEDMSVDWDSLLEINPDTIAWIYIPGTKINYPVVYSGDDSTYLHTDFYGDTNWMVSFGAIFLSGLNNPDFSDDNNVLYGHHMNDGSMFASIAELVESEEFNEHRTVYILTPEGNYRCTTFALDHVGAWDPVVQVNFDTEEEREEYVQGKIDNSVVTPDTDIPAAADIDKMFMLSTCDNLMTDGRYILFCYVAQSTHPDVVGLEQGGAGIARADRAAAQSVADAAKEY